MTDNSLFIPKIGGGLAAIAYDLALNGIPTLSLPTTGMSEFNNDEPPELAQQAIADVWRAIGFDFNIAIL